ncbi:hypothetical protein ASF73_01905 [Xanthomonas sp. Leaf131]|nr:hypothetical protein ASF73_01905 [Xanthomonas sp. Leaf131]
MYIRSHRRICSERDICSRPHIHHVSARLLLDPRTRRCTQFSPQCLIGTLALRKARLQGSALCCLRLFGLRSGRCKHGRHRGGGFELQCVLCWSRCIAFGICRARGLREPCIHRRGRRMRRQPTQQ